MKAVLILLACLLASAHAAHITDKLVVGVYHEPALEGEPLQLITSGTPVEVLERGQGVVRVRLADDSKGWIESGYVTDDKPASMMLLEAQAELRQLKRQFGDVAGAGEGMAPETVSTREAELEEQLSQAQVRIQRLQEGQAELLAARMAQQKLEVLRERVNEAVRLLGGDLESGPSAVQASTSNEAGLFERYLPWVVGAAMLLVGFAAGVGFIDYRIRKRYGGFRI